MRHKFLLRNGLIRSLIGFVDYIKNYILGTYSTAIPMVYYITHTITHRLSSGRLGLQRTSESGQLGDLMVGGDLLVWQRCSIVILDRSSGPVFIKPAFESVNRWSLGNFLR